ncbi:ABC transporter ATP-binding protein [Tenacibaculum agarivorans]|uniref:ABC transporter ATP-binding protein n=1 Tax=Tenacibaculum agarivorans TaxID=1908389 RepID=UPI00094BBA04|nr:ABC transporter ATP-binding protein [Tenacibaculum agarivorans]
MKSQKNKIIISNLKKSFFQNNEEQEVLNISELVVKENEFITFIGKSGCGKTTMLNVLAGFSSYEGRISIFGEDDAQSKSSKTVVFQEDAVFPWMTVRNNIEYGLKRRGLSKELRDFRLNELLKLVDLEGTGEKFPKQLSGGMKKRVDIARAIASSPSIILMDEPFGSLDYQTRRQLQKKLIDLLKIEPKTIFFVTHDINEAILLSDRIIILPSNKEIDIKDIKVPFSKPRDLSICDSLEFIQLRKQIEILISNLKS